MPDSSQPTQRILYCRCAYAQTVPQGVKDDVLQRLSESGQPFEAVADLCEMSASRDPRLQQLADGGGGAGGCLKIAACYPRAVKWLFHAAGSPLPEDGVEVINMRELDGKDAAAQLLNGNTPSPVASNSTSHVE